MCQIDYTKSIKKISHQDRMALINSRAGKDSTRCNLHYNPDKKTLFIGTPNAMEVTKAGDTVDKMFHLYKSVADRICPIALPRGVA